MLMFKVAVAILAVVLYLPAISGHIVWTIIGSAIVIIIGLAYCWWGLSLNYRYPRHASFAIGGWTIAWIVILAIVSVIAAWGVVHIASASPATVTNAGPATASTKASPATASTSVKTLAALGTAAVSAVLAWLLGGR